MNVGGGGFGGTPLGPPSLSAATGDRQMPMMQSRTNVVDQNAESYIKASRNSTGGGEIDLPEKTNVVSDVKAADISNPSNVWDYVYILIAVLFIDVVVIALTRFYPELMGRNLNRWYDLFGLNAVIADVLIIVLGFVIARYVYRGFVAPRVGGWNPMAFTGTLVGVQAIHDILFYVGVILPIPRGHNTMIDVFKDYAQSGGAKIIGGDALMMIGSAAVAIVLKGAAAPTVAVFALLTSYALPYLLYTRNQFTILR